MTLCRCHPTTAASCSDHAFCLTSRRHGGRTWATFGDCSLDACVTDPPYGIEFMGKGWDNAIAFQKATWAEVLRVLKPGAHLIAFGGDRTYPRLACAIENAGFEIRNSLAWIYGSGLAKSYNLRRHPICDCEPFRALNNGAFSQRGTCSRCGKLRKEFEGFGTALKPAMELLCLARKPLTGTLASNVSEWGTGALNIDGCRIDEEASRNLGRWPANLIHDGSEEVLAAFPLAPGKLAKASTSNAQRARQNVYGAMTKGSNGREPRGDTGSAARFFYCVKASKKDRAGSRHPTVKPLALLRYLVRLVTPSDGRVLDPFAGSGTTLQAAVEEGFFAVGIEKEAEYITDIERRMRQAKK